MTVEERKTEGSGPRYLCVWMRCLSRLFSYSPRSSFRRNGDQLLIPGFTFQGSIAGNVDTGVWIRETTSSVVVSLVSTGGIHFFGYLLCTGYPDLLQNRFIFFLV